MSFKCNVISFTSRGFNRWLSSRRSSYGRLERRQRPSRLSNWAPLSSTYRFIYCNGLYNLFFCKFINNAFSFNLINLWLSILLNEFINVKKSSTNSNKDLASFFNLEIYSFLTELVNTFRFPEEHNFHLFSFWEFINPACQASIDSILFLCNIDRLIFLEHFY